MGNVRLSYARNPTNGSIDVLDRNDYYAFGMNMYQQNSVYDAMGTPLNYKYNQKELQETGFYDYGWRQYMPDLGRWFGVDKLAESYLSTSPYAYVMNNPIMMYDPDGRSGNWWDNVWTNAGNNGTTTYTNFDSNGNWGNSSFTPFAQEGTATAFYNFLSSGQTGTFRYWSGGSNALSGYMSNGEAHISGDPGILHEVKIKGHQENNSFGDFLNDTGNFNDFYDSMGNSLASNAGNTRIGTNGRIYFPNTNGRIFYGNQYVRTISWAEYGSKIGKVTGPVGKAINAGKIVYGVSQDGWTFGKNAQVATGGVIVGLMGAEAGAVVGAEVGALLFSWTGPGAVVAGIVGGLVGGIWGGMSGEEIGQAIVESRY